MTKSPIRTNVLKWARLKSGINTRRNVDENRELELLKKKSHEIVIGTFFEAKARARDIAPIRLVGCLTSTV
jgi:hypothetical protein